MARVAFALPIAADQVDDLRKTAADLRASLQEFGRSRAEFGLTSVGVWLQETSTGHVLICAADGDVERASLMTSTDSGFDAWARAKLTEWALTPADVERIYVFPPSEELIVWTSDG